MKGALSSLVFAVGLAASADADPIPLASLSDYLETLPALEAEFVQRADGLDVAPGRLFLKRPGRMRFEYEGDGSMVIAAGGALAIFDPRSNENPTRFPLAQTPLKVILERDVDLERADMVVAHWEEGEFTAVRAQDPERPDYGHIDLWFSGDPIQLRRWVVVDSAGFATEMELRRMRLGGRVPNRLFNILAETNAWGDR
ncbi:MAG: outer membrane lipoprotein carrier protein LolA [Pseudomonadota bacterium]